MILPGTLVQYVANDPDSVLRHNGVYTIAGARLDNCRPPWCPPGCDLPRVFLCEVPASHHTKSGIACFGWCQCRFRIIAPPITEADRLEASAPDAPAKPKRVRA